MLTGRPRRRRRRLDPEPERRAAVVPQRDRLEPQAGRRQERAIVVEPDQPGLLESLEARVGGQRRPMPLVAIERDPPPGHLGEGPRVDVIAVRVGQDDRRDRGPVRADALEPLAERPGPDPDVDQQPGTDASNQGRIPPRSAGEHGELNGMAGRLICATALVTRLLHASPDRRAQ